MKILLLILAAVATFSTMTMAQVNVEAAAISESSIANLPRVNGLIRRVDVANSKLRIKHDRIPNLGMPGMTMLFAVSSSSMLNGLNVNDKISFSAENVDDVLTVVWLQKQE